MKKNSNRQIAMHVSAVTIVWNIVLSVFKMIAGMIAHSGAMISDSIHSASDVFSTIIVMVGVQIASKDSDKEHPYGHERMECVAAILLSVVLFGAGAGIGYEGVKKIFFSTPGSLEEPGVLALIAAVVSVVVKETMYWYTRSAAQKTKSSALMADAWHHRSDALSSVGSFIGIFGARMGYPVLDPVASVVICVLIVKAAYSIFMDAIGKMTDRACDAETEASLRTFILGQSGVLGIDQLKTRLFGDRIYVDIEIRADGTMSLEAAHTIAEQVHGAVERTFSDIKHCMIHVNPEMILKKEDRIIRSATGQDCKQLSDIFSAARDQTSAYETYRDIWGWEDTITEPFLDKNQVFVLEEKGQIQGFAAVTQIPVGFTSNSVDIDDGVWLTQMMTSVDHRHRQIGRELFAYVVQYCEDQGTKEIRILTHGDTAGFYKRMGAVCRSGEDLSPIEQERLQIYSYNTGTEK